MIQAGHDELTSALHFVLNLTMSMKIEYVAISMSMAVLETEASKGVKLSTRMPSVSRVQVTS